MIGVIQASKADTHRKFGRFTVRHFIGGVVSNRCFRVAVTYRLCQVSPVFSPLHEMACWFAGIELPRKARIGPGVQITHGRGIVISHKAQIGANCTIFHGVTLGQRDQVAADGTRETFYPVIEDDCWIGPNAVIVGCRIGQGSRIAAGAVVMKDVPPRSIVQGNPSSVVKEDCVPDVRNRAPVMG